MELLEKPYWEKGELVAGLDEAGRGPLAGPVVVACVVYPPFTTPFLDRDSKKLSTAEREYFFKRIVRKALAVSVAFATPGEIERLNIYQATKLAYLKALKKIPFKVSAVFTDYMPLKGLGIPVFSPPKGDEKIFSVASASVVAKVIRDRIMECYSEIYPQYGFEKHKGYPTGEHIKAVKTFGVLEIHRRNYKPIKEFLKKKNLFG
ncbi:MAG TPA: ribonuclease HII [Aquificales bacterium]|nr:ribonuclease HII [Aquificales bacterium]